MEETSILNRIKTAKSLKSAKSDRSSRSKSDSRSPEKKANSAKTTASSAKSPTKSIPKSAKSTSSKSKSPKRKSTAKSDFNSSSFNEVIKSTPEYEDLSFQGLTVVSNKLFTKTTLRKLILAGNNLRSLPPAIADLVNLEYLDISRNPLKVKDVDDPNCLPYEMRTMTSLKYLSISECNLRYVPSTLWMFTSLTTLDLSRNKLGLIVPDIGNLNNLSYLYLSQCHITTLPGEIAFCTELIEIILMANQIESLPDTLKDCKKLKYLRMSFRTFSTLLDTYMENLISKGQIKSEHIPVVVFDLENLSILDLKHTKINNLPENNLQNLQDLHLDYNYFDSFTDSNFTKMSTTLKCLTVSHNLLKTIPNEINELKNLEVLDLSFNSIEALPNEFKINNIKELYLNNNNLHHLNDSLSQFKYSLTKLDLERNHLMDLHESLFQMNNLIYLNLSYNNLKKLPPGLCKIKSLKLAHSYEKLNKTGMWVIGNPLYIPPKSIWQTQKINKIFDYLSMYDQRNLNYVFYSKLIFIGESGIGKSRLIDAFFDKRTEFDDNNDIVLDYRTKVARKFYKRTHNRVEWMILDIGGDPIYRQLHSLFFSSIDFENEPTIFVIVYNHNEYNKEKHDKLIGAYLESILMHTNSSSTRNNKIKLKLIGICANNDGAVDHIDLSSKKENIFEMSKKTIQSFNKRLLNEKEKNVILLNSSKDRNITEENLNYLRQANEKIDSLLRKSIEIDSDLLLIDNHFSKNNVERVMNSLENMTLEFKKIAPMDLKLEFKNYLTKLKTNRVNLDELKNDFQNSNLNKKITENKNEFQLNIEKIIHYAKTIGDLFWLKYNKNLSKEIYLHFNYFLNCLKTFINHDMIKKLESNNKENSFRSIGIFTQDDEYIQSISKSKMYGMIESKLIKGICFDSNSSSTNQVDDNVKFLKDFSIAYESEASYLDDVCAYYQIIIPTMCSSSYFNEKKIIENSSQDIKWYNQIYTDNYERYFLSLDYLRSLRDYLKIQNSLTKKMIIWNLKDQNEFGKDYVDENHNKVNLELINVRQVFLDPVFMNSSQILNNLDQTNIKANQLKTFIQKLESKYSYEAKIDCCSPFKFESNLFSKLSVLIQEVSFERFDWCDTIIGRNLDDTCFKIQLLSQQDNINKIRFEIKATDLEFLNKFKQQLMNLISFLFSFYPGLYFYKEYTV